MDYDIGKAVDAAMSGEKTESVQNVSGTASAELARRLIDRLHRFRGSMNLGYRVVGSFLADNGKETPFAVELDDMLPDVRVRLMRSLNPESNMLLLTYDGPDSLYFSLADSAGYGERVNTVQYLMPFSKHDSHGTAITATLPDSLQYGLNEAFAEIIRKSYAAYRETIIGNKVKINKKTASQKKPERAKKSKGKR